MNAFLQWLQQAIEEPSLTQQQIFATISVIALLWLIRSVANRMLYRRIEDPHSLYQWRKAVAYVTAIFAFLTFATRLVSFCVHFYRGQEHAGNSDYAFHSCR